ncbi:Arc family DNA-binding protein [Stutzerimonas nitrititolerans]|uniref:Arc family DNA-binding protein n=1 Tax=Stutzerimonas nitrititolerans TaxID=2482751 RepID=UPI002896AD2D|nr:Arc family DNA-binding protein [Stutzerimonas nitrititolerans]
MSRTDQQFKLRMPAALRAQVERSAWAARRSLNAEIVLRLESSFGQVAPSTNEQERSA